MRATIGIWERSPKYLKLGFVLGHIALYLWRGHRWIRPEDCDGFVLWFRGLEKTS